MLKYICKKCCNLICETSICTECGERTKLDKSEIYWCEECNVPIFDEQCDKCGNTGKYIGTDIRPVFPEERLLIEVLLDKPYEFVNKSIWCTAGSNYIVDGKKIKLSLKELIANNSLIDLRKKLSEHLNRNEEHIKKFYDQEHIKNFIQANKLRLNYVTDEAIQYIKESSKNYSIDELFVSFSGGKDSTVTSDLVLRALGREDIIHIYGDTTLEYPETGVYLKKFREVHPKTTMLIAKNKEQNFNELCEVIGPPSRMMRWCCTIFKTGAITRKIESTFKDKKDILTFMGVRRNESAARSKYDRVANGADVKIQKQTVAAPIFNWNDLEVWLYMLGENVDFNDAYRLGYDRVGCWCCPNNTVRSQLLAKIYMPEQSTKWRDYLISFAKSIGKPDPEVYVDDGKWKARQGGNGLAAAEDVKIKFTNCTAEEHAKIYKLNKPLTDDFYNLFIPFGKVSRELGRKLLHEVLVLDMATNVPILSIQPFSQDDYNYAVKIRTLNVAKHEDLQRMVAYQIRKYNACKRCLKCESVCSFDAISVSNLRYNIDENKCRRCKKCITAKYLEGGCLMDRFLRSKEEK